ncbi:MAG TPA: hypothetical protein VK801_04135 [Caulobacteraceae bacterium]|jgi:hypothetical protein|nr:hypothetical protein [Caulobacteraceae bacterium]
MLLMLFRGALALQVAALLAQPILAGLILIGDAFALSAHMAVGAASLILAAVQAGAGVLLARSGTAPRWLAAANVVFLIVEGLQMGAGRLGLLAIHLPLGVALFGAAVLMSAYAASFLEPTPAQPSRGRQSRHHTAQVAQRGG